MTIETHLFEQVADAVRSLMADDGATLHLRSHRRGVKAWFGPRDTDPSSLRGSAHPSASCRRHRWMAYRGWFPTRNIRIRPTMSRSCRSSWTTKPRGDQRWVRNPRQAFSWGPTTGGGSPTCGWNLTSTTLTWLSRWPHDWSTICTRSSLYCRRVDQTLNPSSPFAHASFEGKYAVITGGSQRGV